MRSVASLFMAAAVVQAAPTDDNALMKLERFSDQGLQDALCEPCHRHVVLAGAEQLGRWLVLQAHAPRTGAAQDDGTIEIGAAASLRQRVQLRSAALQRRLAWLRGGRHAFTSLRDALIDDADGEPL